MPEKARVFIAEDDPGILDYLRMIAEEKGHNVLLTAATLADALAAIKNIPEVGIQVASIDGNLQKRVTSGSDGRQMIAAIREIDPSVRIIGMSALPMEGVDINLGKSNMFELGQVITEL